MFLHLGRAVISVDVEDKGYSILHNHNVNNLTDELISTEEVVGKNYARDLNYGLKFADYTIGTAMTGQTINDVMTTGIGAITGLKEGDKLKIKGNFKGYIINPTTLIVNVVLEHNYDRINEIEITHETANFFVTFFTIDTNVPALYVEKAPEESLNLTPNNNIYFEEAQNTTYINAIDGVDLWGSISRQVYYPTSLDIDDPIRGVSATSTQASIVINTGIHQSSEFYIKGKGTMFFCNNDGFDDIIVEKATFNNTKLHREDVAFAGSFNALYISFDNTDTNPPQIIRPKFNDYYNIGELQNYAMKKRYPGQNIFFDNDGIHDTISSFMEINLTSSNIVQGYYIDRNADYGDTLDLTPIQDPNGTSAYLILEPPEYGSKYLVYGQFIAYTINENNVVQQKEIIDEGLNPDGSIKSTIISGSGMMNSRLVIIWDFTEVWASDIFRLLDSKYFTELEHRVARLESQIGTINTTLTNINTGTGV